MEWEGQTDLAPASSPVYLQIYNKTSTLWETVDSDNTAAVNTDFSLIANLADITAYRAGDGVVTCRIYQLGL